MCKNWINIWLIANIFVPKLEAQKKKLINTNSSKRDLKKIFEFIESNFFHCCFSNIFSFNCFGKSPRALKHINNAKENPIISDIKIKGIKAKRIKEGINNVLSIREKSSFNEIRLLEEQEKILDKASNKAVDQVIKERKTKRRNLIKEWFRFAELVSQQIRKYLSWVYIYYIIKRKM